MLEQGHAVGSRSAAGGALASASSALIEAELAQRPAERYLGAHAAAMRVAAVVLSARAGTGRRSGLRNVWQLLAEAAPEYAEWAGFFAAIGTKCQVVAAGAVALVGSREADDLVRDVRLFHDQIAGRLHRIARARGA